MGQEAILDYSLYCGARKHEPPFMWFSIDIHLLVCLSFGLFFSLEEEGSTLFRLIQFFAFPFPYRAIVYHLHH